MAIPHCHQSLSVLVRLTRSQRTGYDFCKNRRKKCGQRLPIYSRCSEQDLWCHYAHLKGSSLVSRETSPQPLGSPLTWNGVSGLTTSEMKLFHYFHSQTLPTLGSSSVQDVSTLVFLRLSVSISSSILYVPWPRRTRSSSRSFLTQA